MKNRQKVVIFSPCLFTRLGLEGVVDALSAPSVLQSLSALPAALEELMTSTRLDVLVLHVTALVADDDWWRFDSVLSLRELQCHTLILVDPECASTLASMPTLRARGDRIMSSAVPRRELMAYLEGVITESDLYA